MARKRSKKAPVITPEVLREIRLELSRRSFYDYAQLRAPDFYKEDREFLQRLCHEFQDFMAAPERLLVINLPPRHGKARTASLFTEWAFGEDPTRKVMIGSYNEILSQSFSRAVRGGIQMQPFDDSRLCFADVFPGISIEQGDGAVNKWALAGQNASYLATSPGGTATGFGANLVIIDDIVKNHLEAFDDLVLERHWEWFVNNILSRTEAGYKLIIIMTRWSSRDLAGRLMEDYQRTGRPFRHVSMRAWDGKKMLCPEILPYEEYMEKTQSMGKDIVAANYDQEPLDLKGRLYSRFKTYTQLPEAGGIQGIRAYVDTADEGNDFLCAIIYAEFMNEAYVLDVYYTQDAMEKTEPELARRLFAQRVNSAKIESNNGGRGFARTIKRLLAETHKSEFTRVSWFHQSKNKTARILSHATWVMDHVYFPANWGDRWPEYYKAMHSYLREGKNAHDDAPDATTGVAEVMTTGAWGW